MEFTEARSHELRIRVDLTDLEAFAYHKRFSATGLTINVTQVRVTAEFFDDERKPHVSVAVFGHGILKDGNLGAERSDRFADLNQLPDKVRRNVEAHIASFAAEIGHPR